MGFSGRKRIHDKVLAEDLPRLFRELGIQFQQHGYEATLPQDDMVVTSLEDSAAQSVRFRPDGVVRVRNAMYFVELKTVLETQQSANYDFEMSPWEKAMGSHKQGGLVAYMFWPAKKVCWVADTKPDWIGVPKWRWSEHDYLRTLHRYESTCPVRHIATEGGSGTIFGLIHWDRIRAMQTFDTFWKEVQGIWKRPRQLQIPLTSQ